MFVHYNQGLCFLL